MSENTVGLELEWADVDRHAFIDPSLGTWNTEDYSIVNSTGVANCKTGTKHRWGGEINTTPSSTSARQGEIVEALANQLNPVINYKCNLHVHVKPRIQLLEDIELLKRAAQWMRAQEKFVYSVVEVLVRPSPDNFSRESHFKGAVKRYRRNLRGHQGRPSDTRWIEMMAAKTAEEFKLAHAPPTRKGGRAFHIAPRCGMNLRSLFKHGTIEYRHFPGTRDPVEAESAARWCLRFTEAALTQSGSAADIYQAEEWNFPEFREYDHNLQMGYDLTKRG